MKLEKSLYQRSWIYFVIFFLFMLWGFWVTYFTKILNQENYRMHLHGAALILWCLMLIIQPYLIRSKQVKIHRTLGKFSYILVPFLLFTTVDLLKYRLNGKSPVSNVDSIFVALVINALIAFIIFYGLAIYHRGKGTIHARYMLSTPLPFITPITDRIININFPSWLGWLPKVGGEPLVMIYGFAIADLLVIGLCIWDWRSHKRLNVFPFVLLVLIAYHFSVLYFYKYSFWIKFSEWFVSF